MKKSGFDISGLSPHLFWDVDAQDLSMEKDFAFIVKRILEYGLMEDWKALSDHFSIEEISEAVMQFRDLDTKSLSFISALSKQPKEKFRCYTTRQLIPPHWTS